MNKLKAFFKDHYIFLILFIIALTLRLYRIDILTTFGRDQGIDFLVVRDMVADQKWTLLGIKTSIGEFFQGPNYLYIILPFFWLLNLNPLAGAYTAVIISLVTLLVLYIGATFLFNKKIALLSSILFTFSPEFIKYGNTPLYQHFVPLPLLIMIFILLKIDTASHRKYLFSIIIGFLGGFAMELHFLAISFVIMSFVYLLIKAKQDIVVYISFIVGLIVGLLPTIIFELKHSFLNTHLFIEYFTGKERSSDQVINLFSWTKGGGMFLGGYSEIAGALFLILTLSIFMKNQNQLVKNINYLIFILMCVLLVLNLVLKSLEPHYLLPLWVLLLLYIPVSLLFVYKMKEKIVYLFFLLLTFINLIYIVPHLMSNHGYNMPNGWNLRKIEQTAEIITTDTLTHHNFNVASLVDGDTRAYPLRYSLTIRNIPPHDVTNYPSNDFLYVVTTTSRLLLGAGKIWEITSLEPYKVTQQWDLGENIILLRLDRQKTPSSSP